MIDLTDSVEVAATELFATDFDVLVELADAAIDLLHATKDLNDFEDFDDLTELSASSLATDVTPCRDIFELIDWTDSGYLVEVAATELSSVDFAV